jgi:hypothetical protein
MDHIAVLRENIARLRSEHDIRRDLQIRIGTRNLEVGSKVVRKQTPRHVEPDARGGL